MLAFQGLTQVIGSAYYWLQGEAQGYGHLITGLAMLVPGVFILGSIPYFRRRADFLRALDTLELVVAASPEDARDALADLDHVARLKTSDDVCHRAKALAATIRNATREGLPIAAAPSDSYSNSLPRPVTKAQQRTSDQKPD
jgi:hypothetical protein